MERYRGNAVDCLEANFRYVAKAGLHNRQSYDEIREALRREGLAEDRLPSDESLRAYRKGGEMQAFADHCREFELLAYRRQAQWAAIERAGGYAPSIQVAIFELLESVHESLAAKGDDEAALAPAELAKLSSSLASLQRLAQSESARQTREELENLRQELERARQAKGAGPVMASLRVKEALDRIFGLAGPAAAPEPEPAAAAPEPPSGANAEPAPQSEPEPAVAAPGVPARGQTPDWEQYRSFFLPYQWQWIVDDRRAKLCEKSRRVGWTYCSSFRRVRRALEHAGLDAWWMTRDLVTAREFIRYCKQWCLAANAVARGLEGEELEDLVPEREIKAQVIRFRNGSRICVLSSNPDAAAGKGGDLGLDEFALHPRQELLYQVARPVIMWGHQLEIISTHRRRDTVFNRLIAESRGANAMRWSHHRVTLPDAVAAGLVEKINAAGAARGLPPLSREAFIARERAGCLDEAMWRQEYLCEPQDGDSSLLAWEAIRDCEAAPEDLAGLDLCLGRGPRVAGMDVGRSADRSAIWVLELLGDVAYTRELRVLDRVPFAAQLDTLGEMLRRHQVSHCCIDATGSGAMLAEEAARQFRVCQVQPVTFTAPVKEQLALGLWRRCEERRLRLPADAAVREDLYKVQRVAARGGRWRYEAPRDASGHADRFWALALAIHALPALPEPAAGERLPVHEELPRAW